MTSRLGKIIPPGWFVGGDGVGDGYTQLPYVVSHGMGASQSFDYESVQVRDWTM